MNAKNLLFPDPNQNPREWIAATQEYFLSLNKQGETEIIATYQSLQLIECLSKDNPRIRSGLEVIKKAAVARMHTLVESTPLQHSIRIKAVFRAVIGQGFI